MLAASEQWAGQPGGADRPRRGHTTYDCKEGDGELVEEQGTQRPLAYLPDFKYIITDE